MPRCYFVYTIIEQAGAPASSSDQYLCSVRTNPAPLEDALSDEEDIIDGFLSSLSTRSPLQGESAVDNDIKAELPVRNTFIHWPPAQPVLRRVASAPAVFLPPVNDVGLTVKPLYPDWHALPVALQTLFTMTYQNEWTARQQHMDAKSDDPWEYKAATNAYGWALQQLRVLVQSLNKFLDSDMSEQQVRHWLQAASTTMPQSQDVRTVVNGLTQSMNSPTHAIARERTSQYAMDFCTRVATNNCGEIRPIQSSFGSDAACGSAPVQDSHSTSLESGCAVDLAAELGDQSDTQESAFSEFDGNDDDFRTLTDGQLAFMRELYAEEDPDIPFLDWMGGWQHEAGEEGVNLSVFVETYLVAPAHHQHHDSDSTAESLQHPLLAVISHRQPTGGWLNLRRIVATLQSVRRMALRQLLARTGRAITSENESELRQVLHLFPEIFWLSGDSASAMVSLRPVDVHLSSCPSAQQRRRTGRHTNCQCIWSLCNALHRTTPSDVGGWGSCSAEADGLVDDGEEEEEEITEPAWWDLGDLGGGCDAEAMVEALWGFPN